MQFTQEQKNQYLDKLALSTQQGMWLTDMAMMKATEKLAKKRALLTVIDGKIEKKEYFAVQGERADYLVVFFHVKWNVEFAG